MIVDYPFQIEVVRTARRKSASLEVHGDVVRVLVPETLSDQRVKALIDQRSVWIKQRLAIHAATPVIQERELEAGQAFPYLGRNYRLKLLDSDEYSVKLKHGYLQVSFPKSPDAKRNAIIIKKLLTTWYRSHAYDRLHEKTKRYSAIIGVQPTAIVIDDFKARWGSCLDTGHISFNWRIILAPHHIVDYVVIHELCHLIQHDHSPKYWKLVEQHCPNYSEHKNWLKHNSGNLNI